MNRCKQCQLKKWKTTSKPTRPAILSATISSITVSFSVEFGSVPITNFFLNVSQSNSGTEFQKNLSLYDMEYLIENVNSEGVVIGYDVEMVVTGLKERVVYQFEVAAESSVGVGEFSEPSENAKAGKLYTIFKMTCHY